MGSSFAIDFDCAFADKYRKKNKLRRRTRAASDRSASAFHNTKISPRTEHDSQNGPLNGPKVVGPGKLPALGCRHLCHICISHCHERSLMVARSLTAHKKCQSYVRGVVQNQVRCAVIAGASFSRVPIVRWYLTSVCFSTPASAFCSLVPIGEHPIVVGNLNEPRSHIGCSDGSAAACACSAARFRNSRIRTKSSNTDI